MTTRQLVPSVLLLMSAQHASGQTFVPFAIPAEQNKRSLIAMKAEPIRTDSPRVTVRHGHFYVGEERYRVWGVNLCFAGCFPPHADAERIAARMSAFGVNSVRFHHMDGRTFPSGIWDPHRTTKLSVQAMDRLDYFIDQLARRGIRANINLHVSRTHSVLLKLPKAAQFDKMVDMFTPKLIDAQRTYARDLLTHVNKYRRARYADDPAVAFVEITNEDSLFMWGWEEKLRSLDDHYAKILRWQYNEWLSKRYGTTAKLRAAWGKGALPLGENMLAGLTHRKPTKERPHVWRLEVHRPCEAAVKPVAGTSNAVRIEIARADNVSWHIQLNQADVAVKAGGFYTLTFRARADKPRDIYYNVCQAHSPWKVLGLGRTVALKPEWQTFRAGGTVSAADDNARVNFGLGQSDVAVELADVEFRPGGREGLVKDESLEAKNVALFGSGETDARALDRMKFLAETEKAYFDDMYAFIKKDLGCKALVTGTMAMGPLGLWGQQDMDYIDNHAYWHHPHFPGRPWDPANWTVEQSATVDHLNEAPFGRLAASRLAGKPYTVSEYNHPAPSDYQAECVPTIASVAALQDWDGVWLFAYNHDGDWKRRHFRSFFDIDMNPSKWGFVAAGAAIFRTQCLTPLGHGFTFGLADGADRLSALATLQHRHQRNLHEVALRINPKIDWKGHRLSLALTGRSDGSGSPLSQLSHLSWSVEGESSGSLHVEGPGARILIGRPGAKELKGRLDLTRPAFAILTVTAVDGGKLADSSKVLVTACGRCENAEMKFAADRRTVGRDWGGPPTRIEAVEGTLWLAGLAAGNWTCHGLKPGGTAGPEVPIAEGKVPSIELKAEYGTMWYLLTR